MSNTTHLLCFFAILIFSIGQVSCQSNSSRLGYEAEEEEHESYKHNAQNKSGNDYAYIIGGDAIDIEYEDTPVAIPLSKTYYDGKISINYPDSWEIVKKNSLGSGDATLAVVIMQQEVNEYDFRPNVNVIFFNNKYKESTSSLAKTAYNQARNYSQNADFIGVHDCIIGGLKGSVVEYTSLVEGYKLHVYQYIVKKIDNSTICITMTLDHYNLNEQKTIAQEIMKSIKIY